MTRQAGTAKRRPPDIYRQSKIVVNVSRADFPQEANMRVSTKPWPEAPC